MEDEDPPPYGLVPIPSAETPYFEMYNETHANMSVFTYISRYRGDKHLPMQIVIPVTIVYVMIFITGVIGNTLTCIVIVKITFMHTATNFYLFSLAISDLTLLLLGLPNDLCVYWQQYPWPFGEPFCKIRALTSEMSSYSSVLVIVAFSAERYLAVCKPLHSYQMSTLGRASRIIAFIWFVSFIAALPFYYYTKVNYLDFPPNSRRRLEETGFCAMLSANIPQPLPIYEASTVIFFVIPMVLIIILYWRIIRKLRDRDGYTLGGERLEGNVHVGRNQAQSRRAIIRMLGAVVIAFFLCWAPFHLQRLFYIHMVDTPYYQIVNEWLYYITGCFYYFQSTINPILYSLMSAKYRRAFRDTLMCKSWGRSRHPTTSSMRETRIESKNLTTRQQCSDIRRRTISHPTTEEPIIQSEKNEQTVVQVTDHNGNTTVALSNGDKHIQKSSTNEKDDELSFKNIFPQIELKILKTASRETYI